MSSNASGKAGDWRTPQAVDVGRENGRTGFRIYAKDQDEIIDVTVDRSKTQNLQPSGANREE